MKDRKNISCNFIAQTTPYPFHIMVSIGETDLQLRQKLKRYGKDKEDPKFLDFKDDKQRAFYSMMTGNVSLIRIRYFPDTNSDYGDIQHEIFHSVYNIFDVIGMKMSADSEEAYAYMIGYLTETIYNAINHYYLKNK